MNYTFALLYVCDKESKYLVLRSYVPFHCIIYINQLCSFSVLMWEVRPRWLKKILEGLQPVYKYYTYL